MSTACACKESARRLRIVFVGTNFRNGAKDEEVGSAFSYFLYELMLVQLFLSSRSAKLVVP